MTKEVTKLEHDSDVQLAVATKRALECDVIVPKAVTARIHNGSVTLEGEVAWSYQRDGAERALRDVPGIVCVHNAITLVHHSTKRSVLI